MLPTVEVTASTLEVIGRKDRVVASSLEVGGGEVLVTSSGEVLVVSGEGLDPPAVAFLLLRCFLAMVGDFPEL